MRESERDRKREREREGKREGENTKTDTYRKRNIDRWEREGRETVRQREI